MTLIDRLGIFVAQYRDPPPLLVDRLTLHLVDTVGAWVAGRFTGEGKRLLDWRRISHPGAGAPQGIGTERLRLDVATHCALARLSESDDIHLASTTTPGAIVVPAILTVAAALGVRDPAALAAAALAGYEIMVRFGRAIDGAAILYRGIWPTYFAAPMTVAAVASRLLGLDARQTAHALALALARAAPGIGHHNAATTSRWLALGQAADCGVVAALAARAGFTSDLALLDGGFLPGIYGIKPDPAALTPGPDDAPALVETSFKPWCAARQTMAATQALIEIMASGVAPDAIVHVVAFVPPPHRRMVDHGVTAGDRSSFLTSLPYRLALAALSPQAAFAAGQAPAEVPDVVHALMGRIAVDSDDALLAGFPQQWPARVEAVTASGRHVRVVTQVPGDPGRPFDAAAVEHKFRRFVEPAIGAQAATQVLRHALGLLGGETTAAEMIEGIETACA